MRMAQQKCEECGHTGAAHAPTCGRLSALPFEEVKLHLEHLLMEMTAERDKAISEEREADEHRHSLLARLKETELQNQELKTDLAQLHFALGQEQDAYKKLEKAAERALDCLGEDRTPTDRREAERFIHGILKGSKKPKEDPPVVCPTCGAHRLCQCGHPVDMHRPKCFWIGLCGCKVDVAEKRESAPACSCGHCRECEGYA